MYNLKKFTCLIIALILMFALCACGDSETADPIKDDQPPVSDVTLIDENDPAYGGLKLMFPCTGQFIEYNHILNGSVNYDDIGAEDFWNITALILSSYERSADVADTDVAGIYHIHRADAENMASAYMPGACFGGNIPNFRESYSTSADPGSDVIDIEPLSLDNYDIELEYIEYSGSNEYVMHIALKCRTDNERIYHYEAFLSEWDSFVQSYYPSEVGKDHIMPYVLTGYAFTDTEEAVDTEETAGDETSGGEQ